MDVREKLVELLQDANNPVLRWFQYDAAAAQQLADYLINSGVIVDVATVRHGRWTLALSPYDHTWAYKCTACNGFVNDETSYCPNCGAKMD